MKLIIGLGNPGNEYNKTRHNIGFLALDYIASYINLNIDKKKFKSLYIKDSLYNNEVVLIKPQTYMNLSGSAVNNFANFYSISPQDIIVIQDDIDLNFGIIRIKNFGGHGGHNGIRDIANKLNTRNFIRIKIGVGRPDNPNFPVDKYVLSNFSKQQINELDEIFYYTLNAIKCIFEIGISEAMNEFNRKNS